MAQTAACNLADSGRLFHRFNSAVFTSIQANIYTASLVTPALLDRAGLSENASTMVFSNQIDNTRASQLRLQYGNTTFQRLTPKECFIAYAQPFLSGRRDVLFASTLDNETDIEERTFRMEPSLSSTSKATLSWLCYYDEGSIDCDIDAPPPDKIKNIDHCLSEIVEEKCKVQFSLHIIVVVILCNVVKLCSMILILWKYKNPTLVTIGDAVSSFLDDSDITTKGMCLASKKSFTEESWSSKELLLETYTKESALWFHAASRKRWLVCNLT